MYTIRNIYLFLVKSAIYRVGCLLVPLIAAGVVQEAGSIRPILDGTFLNDRRRISSGARFLSDKRIGCQTRRVGRLNAGEKSIRLVRSKGKSTLPDFPRPAVRPQLQPIDRNCFRPSRHRPSARSVFRAVANDRQNVRTVRRFSCSRVQFRFSGRTFLLSSRRNDHAFRSDMPKRALGLGRGNCAKACGRSLSEDDAKLLSIS